MLHQVKSQELQEAFRNPKTADSISELADAYVRGIRDNTFKQQGFSQSMYGMSKVCEMSYTRWLAGQVQSKVWDSGSLQDSHCCALTVRACVKLV